LCSSIIFEQFKKEAAKLASKEAKQWTFPAWNYIHILHLMLEYPELVEAKKSRIFKFINSFVHFYQIFSSTCNGKKWTQLEGNPINDFSSASGDWTFFGLKNMKIPLRKLINR
jgi:hypothetical protein